MDEYKVIPFTTEDGEEVALYVLEQTMLNNVRYLLVTDDVESETADAYVMKEVKEQKEEQEVYITYEMVEEDDELAAISKIFDALLEDTDIIL